jgi:hypothetical protein
MLNRSFLELYSAAGLFLAAPAKAPSGISAAMRISRTADLGLTEFSKHCTAGAFGAAEKIA